MDKSKRLKKTIKSIGIAIIVIIIAITTIMLVLYRCVHNENATPITYRDIIIGALKVPEDSEALFESGEGTSYRYYGKIRLSTNGVYYILSKSKEVAGWTNLPLATDIAQIRVLPEDFPITIKKGIYYFNDKYSAEVPEEQNININERGGYIFELAVLDLDTSILYILLYE